MNIVGAYKPKQAAFSATPPSDPFFTSFAPCPSGSFCLISVPQLSARCYNPIAGLGVGVGVGGDSLSFPSSDANFQPLSSVDYGDTVTGSSSLYPPAAPGFYQDPYDPFASAAPTHQKTWTRKESSDGLCVKMNMPGLSKENVKLTVEKNMLVIKGEVPKAAMLNAVEKNPVGYLEETKYSKKIPIVSAQYKLDEIKAEMRNGVLQLFVPKIKEEDRTDVLVVKVE